MHELKDCYEYKIFVGCNDAQTHDEVVGGEELKVMIAQFFERNRIDFSIFNVTGGYLYEDGCFVTEDTLCVNFIGDSELDISRFAKSLSMYMNQELLMITRQPVRAQLM
ncbi:MAG: hypothetical protein KBS63_03120 [Clostridiales bacterium]|nr:hypothetical protein [Candidatus Crickella caballi]